MSSIFYIEIWGRFKMYAFITNTNLSNQSGELNKGHSE